MGYLAERRGRRRGEPVSLSALLPDRSRGQAISRLELITAMPAGARRPRSRRELMRAFHADPRLAFFRADFAANLVTTMQLGAIAASWADTGRDLRATTRPTRAWMAEKAGYCLSTWKACRRVLEAWGWWFLVRPGRTERARRMSSAAGLQYAGNDAAVYGLAIPRLPRDPRKHVREKQPDQPPASASPVTRPPMSRAPVAPNPAGSGVDNQESRTALRAGSSPKPADLRALAPAGGLEKLTDRAVSACWRPFEAALWSPAEWLWAAAHWPDGRPHATDGMRVRFPASWLRWRLSLWLDPNDGRPVLPPSLRARAEEAAGRVRELRLAAEQRAAIAARHSPDPADAAPHFEQLRAERGWSRKRGPRPGS